ncbi:MAG: hypothetical protein ACE5OS_06060 [Anaerolineae bacterium]
MESVSAKSNKSIEEYRRNFKARLKRQLEGKEKARQREYWSMNEQVRLLQAEIRADLQAIEEAYAALNSVSKHIAEPEMDVVVGY